MEVAAWFSRSLHLFSFFIFLYISSFFISGCRSCFGPGRVKPGEAYRPIFFGGEGAFKLGKQQRVYLSQHFREKPSWTRRWRVQIKRASPSHLSLIFFHLALSCVTRSGGVALRSTCQRWQPAASHTLLPALPGCSLCIWLDQSRYQKGRKVAPVDWRPPTGIFCTGRPINTSS